MSRPAGNLQRIRNGERRYAITPRIPGGLIHPDMLIRIAEVAKRYHGVLKITGAQRIMITNLKAEDLNDAWAMLGLEPVVTHSNVVRSVRICPGTTFCKRGKQDAIRLGLALEKRYIGQSMPSKLKMAVSGCHNSCSEALTKDIGFIGTDTGWDVYVGGSAGAHPRFGTYLTTITTDEEALTLVDRILQFYKAHALIERMGPFLDRMGLSAFADAVLDDTLRIARRTRIATKEQEHPGTPALLVGLRATEQPITESTEGSEPTASPRRGMLQPGEPITRDSLISSIIATYPATTEALQSIGMGCLGCPSATSEPLHQAAQIHGVDVDTLVAQLNKVRLS